MLFRQFHLSYTYQYIQTALTLCSTVLWSKLKGSLTLSLLKAAVLDFAYHVEASVLSVGKHFVMFPSSDFYFYRVCEENYLIEQI